MTDPDWVPIMKKASGIITTSGGRTCHAAIVSRELGIPAIVGAVNAMDVLKSGQHVTIDCSLGKTGYVYEGEIQFTVENIEIKKLPKPAVPIMVNLGMPEQAFTLSFMPVSGVGLARLEFIISNTIQIHPMAIVEPEKVTDPNDIKKIKDLTSAYKDAKTFYIDSLAQGMGTIAAAFYPRPVYIRLPDFKTNEYCNLIGGKYFEKQEDNPAMGLRGASRYYHEGFKKAFALDCESILQVREKMGITNIKLMIPFVRTVEEGQKVLQLMTELGLSRGKKGFDILMMCEVPANVLMIDELSKLFDGFSIGSNDLTQFTLSVDRDSTEVAGLFKEDSPAERKMLALAVEGAHRNSKYIGICGQAPSDYPDIAEFLICEHIDSISLNADSIIPFLMRDVRCKHPHGHKNITLT
jgi:pyruvate,water dikinase